jgi:PadR family transcriptional regulator PadR
MGSAGSAGFSPKNRPQPVQGSRLRFTFGRECSKTVGIEPFQAAAVSLLVNLQEGPGPVSDQTDLIQGTLDLLILRTIALEPMHGWAIAQRIQQISDEMLRVQQGSLYPALHRLEHQGWITAEWGASDNNRRARFYSLTRAGRKQLAMELSKWERLSAGVNLVLART